MSEAKISKPIYQKWWFWVIVAVVVLAIIGGVVGGSGNTNQGDNPNQGNSGSDNTVKEYFIGDTVTVGTLQYTVDKVYDTKQIGTVIGSTTENNFVVVEVTVKNNGTSKVSLTSSYVMLQKGAVKYECTSDAIYLDDGFYLIKEIGPELTQKIVFVFETPTESSTGEYVLVVKQGLSSEEIKLKTK